VVSRLMILVAVSMVPATFSAPASAQSQPRALDPNERVCENLTMVGSRLAKKRVCATRAEWEERRREDRQAVDQIQKQIVGPCQVTPGSKNGGPVAC
jgi:hypothetical protein